MPRKPKKPCAYPGCPALTEGRYCEKHQKAVAAQYERYGRDPNTKKRYGAAWKRIRARYISEHPLCESCKREGHLTPAREVHHIIPLAHGGTHDPGNLLALCKACHSRITARESGFTKK